MLQTVVRAPVLRQFRTIFVMALSVFLLGCAAREAPPASARARERAAPNSAVRSGRVTGIKVSGLRISFVFGGGRTVYLPDGHYRHRDGYILIVSGGRFIGLEGIPPGQIVSARARASNPGRGRGKNKKNKVKVKKGKIKVKIKTLKVEGTRITFVGDDGGRVVLAGGVYTSSAGHKVRIADGHIRSIEIDD